VLDQIERVLIVAPWRIANNGYEPAVYHVNGYEARDNHKNGTVIRHFL